LSRDRNIMESAAAPLTILSAPHRYAANKKAASKRGFVATVTRR
jgi:hypothetical protein